MTFRALVGRMPSHIGSILLYMTKGTMQSQGGVLRSGCPGLSREDSLCVISHKMDKAVTVRHTDWVGMQLVLNRACLAFIKFSV